MDFIPRPCYTVLMYICRCVRVNVIYSLGNLPRDETAIARDAANNRAAVEPERGHCEQFLYERATPLGG